jgi:hypothetical protein
MFTQPVPVRRFKVVSEEMKRVIEHARQVNI